ncbi:hypothetical protein DQ04_08801000 [Trypanosoma grayi]|uniref:hypothetical protein n=1 Tax=Trypanosoma grayi TaxID=71804 RepID=UPI0004F4B4CB|nr:hypothetical protein DQ04_08801000 [Trypanosoma grayi]KEG07795.1 hypothetical protein DQ04_08801000 [Trypanosoma grayi]
MEPKAEVGGPTRPILRLRRNNTPSERDAAPLPTLRLSKKERKKKAAAADEQKQEQYEEVIHWIRCDRCDKWCKLPEKLEPSPEYWNCSFIGRKCAVSKKKAKEEAEKQLHQQQPQTKRRGQKSTRNEQGGDVKKVARRGQKKETHETVDEAVPPEVDESEGDRQTLLQAYVSKAKERGKPKRRQVGRRYRVRSPSASSSSSGGTADDSSSSSSSSSTTTTDSSSSSDSATPPRRGGRGHKPRKPPAAKASKMRKHRKRRRTSSSSFEDDTDSDSGKGVHAARRGPPQSPALTAERLAELEAAMDEVETLQLEEHNVKEILARLRSIEKGLR